MIWKHLINGIYPVVYQGENDGHLIRHVCSFMESENKISSQGSLKDFLPHVDNPDLKITGEDIDIFTGNCPDSLSLFCLREKKEVYTSIIKLDDILQELSDNEKKTLLKPIFKVNRPDSFDNNKIIENVPILSLYNNKYYSRFDFHNTLGTNKESLDVLEKIKSISLNKKYWNDFCLKKGEGVTFLNQRVFHSRNNYKPNYDGKDRWLIRIFGLFNTPLNTQLVNHVNCKHHLKS